MEQQTQTADEFDALQGDNSSQLNAGITAEASALTLDELNEVSGRNFSTKEDAIKYVKGLNSLVGDQSIAQARKQAKEAQAAKLSLESLQEEISGLKQENSKKDFLLAHPEVKDNFDLLEAYAKDKGLTYENALKDKPMLGASIQERGETNIKTTNRVAPVKSQKIAELQTQLQTATSNRDELERELVMAFDNQ